MKIDRDKPSTLILENCWPVAIRQTAGMGQRIYSLGDYQSITTIPSHRYIRATLTICDGEMLTEYDLAISDIKDISERPLPEKPVPVKRTGRRITID